MTSDDVNRRMLKLLHVLQQRTATGKSIWTMPRDDEEDRVSLSTRTASFTLQSKDNDGRYPYIFRGYDSAGRIIFTVQTFTSEYSSEVGQAVVELWSTIHTAEGPILGFIDEVLGELDDEPLF